MYYVLNFIKKDVEQLNDLNECRPNFSCDWYTLIPLQYEKYLILGHDHDVGNKPEPDTYIEGTYKNLREANEQIAYLLSENDGIEVCCDQQDAIDLLEEMIKELDDEPDENDLYSIKIYKGMLDQVMAFKED